MASPVVAGTAESSTPTAGTSHVLNWTGLGTVAAGDLLLIILDKGSTSATVNAHADYTELLDEASANGLYIAYRWAVGGEAAPTLVTSASTRSAEITYRITGAANPATTPPQIGTTSAGTSATPDPPASATPPSSKDYLFITFYGAAGEEADDDTWSDTAPTNYTNKLTKACGVAGTNLGGMIAAAQRALTTGVAENPGTFGKDVSAAWRAQTITVHPAASQTFPQAIAATAVGVAIIDPIATFLRTLAATVVGVAVLAPAFVVGKALAATAIGVATLSATLTAIVGRSATAIGVATLLRVATFYRTLTATAIGVSTLTKGMFKTLAASAVGVATLSAVFLVLKTLAATAVGVATLSTKITAAVSVAATAVAVATLNAVQVIGRTLTAIAVGAASLATQFIAGTGDGIAQGIKHIQALFILRGRR